MRIKIVSYALLSCALCACTFGIRQKNGVRPDNLVEFTLSTPNHISDYRQIRDKLGAEGIECSEISDLGTLHCFILERNFQRAKEIVAELIRSNSLTVRVKKQNDSDLFEIYDHGTKITEERYTR